MTHFTCTQREVIVEERASATFALDVHCLARDDARKHDERTKQDAVHHIRGGEKETWDFSASCG